MKSIGGGQPQGRNGKLEKPGGKKHPEKRTQGGELEKRTLKERFTGNRSCGPDEEKKKKITEEIEEERKS